MSKARYYDFINNGNYLAYPTKENPQLLISITSYSSFKKVVNSLKFTTYKFRIFKMFSFVAWFICKFLYINKLGNVENSNNQIIGCAIFLPFAEDEKLTKICLDANSQLFVKKLGWGPKKSLVTSEFNLLKTYSKFTPSVNCLIEDGICSSYNMDYVGFSSNSLYNNDFKELVELMKTTLKIDGDKLLISNFPMYKFIKQKILSNLTINKSAEIKGLLNRCFDVLESDQKLYYQYTCHGDFTESNLVFDGINLLVIDWEHSFSAFPFFEDEYFSIVKNLNSNLISEVTSSMGCLSIIYFTYFILKVDNLSLLTSEYPLNFDLNNL